MKIKAAIISIGFLFLVTVAKCGPNGAASVADNPLNHIVATPPAQSSGIDPVTGRPVGYNPAKDFIPIDPWRIIHGETNYVKTDGVEFCGKVMDVTQDGIRIEGDFGDLFKVDGYDPEKHEYIDFFVASYPFKAFNDDIIYENQHRMAWYVGSYNYSTVNGGSRTIRKLDYGISCDEPKELIEQEIAASNAIVQAKAEINRQRIFLSQSNAVRFLQPQATNGDASAQCSLGLHYLNGQGCETNQKQGIYWLQKAAAQGDLEASSRLAKINLVSTNTVSSGAP